MKFTMNENNTSKTKKKRRKRSDEKRKTEDPAKIPKNCRSRTKKLKTVKPREEKQNGKKN